VQSAHHMLRRGCHAPSLEGGADFSCDTPPVHIMDMCRFELITEASCQAMASPLLMACSATAEVRKSTIKVKLFM